MSGLLIDTSAYSAFLRGHAEIVAAVQKADEIALTPVVLGELAAGFIQGSRRRRNEKYLEDFLASPRVRVVNIDQETAARYAAIWGALKKAGTPIPTNDLWIAASAMQHGLAVLTTDSHYPRIPQILVLFYNSYPKNQDA